MNEFIGLSGRYYHCPAIPMASGGEGFVFDVIEDTNLVAKIYMPDKCAPDREQKLSVMVSNQPRVAEQFAWPLDVLYENGYFIGCIMPKINGKEKLRDIYVYDKRKGKTWPLYIVIAKNLAAAVHNVHEIHQVIGDLNPENILVNPNDGMVTLIDTDSYHIADVNRTYRCGVGMLEFVAPELQGIHFPSAPLPTFTPETDRFALAVLIFQLLMNGAHPFACKVTSGSSSKFAPWENMKNNMCVWFDETKDPKCDIPWYALNLASLPDYIQVLFRHAFVDGHCTPALRPSAMEWYHILEHLENNLEVCELNKQHYFYSGLNSCPWCNIEKGPKREEFSENRLENETKSQSREKR